MPLSPHPACWSDEELGPEVQQTAFRASGPGGQHRNKVLTGVRLVHGPTGLVAKATERRSADQNRRVAWQRLRLKLALEHRCGLEGRALPTPLWTRRTAGASLSVDPDHADVPALLAEALDVLAALDDDLPSAAQRLGVSTTRLVKVLRLEPRALTELNRRQAARDRPTWR